MTAHLPEHCELCPRACGANRAAGKRGLCGADKTLRVARASLHAWEEPPISGSAGSGTVFFSNCPLHCAYCQNARIANGSVGKPITVARLCAIFLELQNAGALNINLVTPTHYLPQIKAALDKAREKGLRLPIVYNTSGYETPETIRSLDGYVDIFLTDFKYADPSLAAKYSNAPDYPEVAASALEAMLEVAGPYALFGKTATDATTGSAAGRDVAPGILKSGVIVRHLMLPGQLEDSKAVVRRVYSIVGDAACISLMNQYTPVGLHEDMPELDGTVSEDDYDALIEYALSLGITNSFMQEGGTAQESFIPDFDGSGV